MNTRHLAVVCLLLALVPPAPAQADQLAIADATLRPNILILVADDMSWSDLELVATPNLDRLAAQGISFTSAYSDPVCSPTRVTCLLGAYSFREQIGTTVRARGTPGLTNAQNPPMGFARVTLAELLKGAGYATLSVGKCHIANNLRGVQSMAMHRHGFDRNLASTQFTLTNSYTNWFSVDDGKSARSTDYNTTVIARAITDWWSETDGPKFCWGAFNAPHAPFHVPPESVLPDGFEVGRSDRLKYEAMIMAMDHEIGNILDTVDTADTIVVFLADNGTPGSASPPGANPNRTKGTVFDAGVRIPLLITGPDIAANAICDALVNTTDLYATFAERLAVPVPAGEAVDSVSMLPYLQSPDAAPQRNWVYSEYWAPNGAGPKTLVRLMARNRTHKLMDLDPDGDGPRPRVEFIFRMEAETFIRPADYTDEDRAALAELRAVLVGKGPQSRPGNR